MPSSAGATSPLTRSPFLLLWRTYGRYTRDPGRMISVRRTPSSTMLLLPALPPASVARPLMPPSSRGSGRRWSARKLRRRKPSAGIEETISPDFPGQPQIKKESSEYNKRNPGEKSQLALNCLNSIVSSCRGTTTLSFPNFGKLRPEHLVEKRGTTAEDTGHMRGVPA